MRTKKRAVLVWHRRAGKEKTCFNYMVMKACQKRGIYYYFFPSFKQGRKILWDGIDKSGFKFLDHIPKELISGKPNETEMKIRLRNGSLIQVIGTDSIDNIVGTNPSGVVFSEFSLQDPRAWDFIRPILTENDGWAIFNFTPRGQNHAKDIYTMASYNEEWYASLLTVKDTGILTEEDLDRERAEGMSEDMLQQEYYCSFTLGIEGAYYAKYIEEMREDGRICKIPWDTQSVVHSCWDIGYGDSTAIIFYQLIGPEVHIVDYYENHGEGLSHYVKVLQDKTYIYGKHYAPHDIDSHQFSTGMSAREVGAGLGLNFTPLPTLRISVEDGIEAARGIFPRLWIDNKKAAPIIKVLENYRKEFDAKYNVYKLRPLHNWASHGADAFRYMAIAIKTYQDASKGAISDAEADRMYNKYNPKFER